MGQAFAFARGGVLVENCANQNVTLVLYKKSHIQIGLSGHISWHLGRLYVHVHVHIIVRTHDLFMYVNM